MRPETANRVSKSVPLWQRFEDRRHGARPSIDFGPPGVILTFNRFVEEFTTKNTKEAQRKEDK
jgi:hypothetical protein